MLMNLIVVAVVLLVAYMWTAQGFFSALIHLLCTLVAGAIVAQDPPSFGKDYAFDERKPRTALEKLIGEGLAHVIALNDSMSGAGTGATLVASASFSAVTDNIPLAAMLSKILTAMNPDDFRLWWSVVFGANLGGNLTPIGSASTVVAVTLMHKYQVPLSFAGFVRAALPFALLQLALAVAYVLLVL